MVAKLTDKIDNAEAKRVIEACLREGFAKPGNRGITGKGSAYCEAARRMGCNDKTLLNRIRAGYVKVDWSVYVAPPADPVVTPPPPPTPDERREIVTLRDQLRELQRALREADRNHVEEEQVRTQIMGLAAATPMPPDWLVERPSASSGVAGVPCCLWSDWHCGEVVNAAEVNGVNEFNFEIAERRIKTLVRSILDLCYSHMTGAEYPGAVINLGGDMISGALHPELAESDEDEIFPTILWTLDRIIAAINEMRRCFPRLHVVCVPGNHGRVFDRKPYNKHYVTRNADWLLYQLLERHFRPDAAVTFQTPISGEALYRVYGIRYMLVHGDDLGVRGGDGIIGAIGPIMRGEIKMRTSSAQIGRDYDVLCLGHWHQRLLLPRAIVNNSLKGYDEYARRSLRAVFTKPSQNLWFTHPKRGVTAHWEVFLDEHVDATEKAWLSV